MSEKYRPGNPEDVRPQTSEPYQATLTFARLMKFVAGMGSVMVIPGDTPVHIPETRPAVTERAPQFTHTVPAKEKSAPEDAAALKEEQRIEYFRSILQQSIDYLNNQEVLEKDVAIFKKGLDSATTCRFVDDWYKPNKKHLDEMWKYMDAKSERWNNDLDQALKEALVISKTVGEKINWWVVPKRFWAPTTEAELRSKIGEYLPKPAATKSSCGSIFDTGFNYLKGQGKVDELQRTIKLLFQGGAQLLITEMEGKKAADVQEELRVANEYFIALGAMIPEKHK